MIKKNLIILLLLMSTSLFAVTIEWGIADIEVDIEDHDPYYTLTINSQYVMPGYDNTFIVFKITDIIAGKIIVSSELVQLTPGTRWLEMQYGDWVDTDTTGSGLDDYFLKHDDMGTEYGSAGISYKSSAGNHGVYLGFVIIYESSSYDDYNRLLAKLNLILIGQTVALVPSYRPLQ